MVRCDSRQKDWTMDDISSCLDIGSQFLFLSTVTCVENTKYSGVSRDPKSLPLQSHFVSREIVPASLIIEFSLQFSAFIVSCLAATESTPIIGDIRYRALAPVYSLESLTIEMVSCRNLVGGAVISSLVCDQSSKIIGRSTYTYSVR